jgi:hypothetical protein
MFTYWVANSNYLLGILRQYVVIVNMSDHELNVLVGDHIFHVLLNLLTFPSWYSTYSLIFLDTFGVEYLNVMLVILSLYAVIWAAIL